MKETEKIECSSDTHYACKEQLEKFGAKTPCCWCNNHKCNIGSPTKETKTECCDTKEKLKQVIQGLPYSHEELIEKIRIIAHSQPAKEERVECIPDGKNYSLGLTDRPQWRCKNCLKFYFSGENPDCKPVEINTVFPVKEETFRL